MPYIQPLSDVNPHDVVNFYKVDNISIGTTGIVNRGTLVKILSGFVNDQQNQTFAGPPGGSVGATYARTVSQRWSIPSSVTPIQNSGDPVLGILLYDVREADENGELLIYHPDKAAALNAVYSGQACPIATWGTFLYSGIVGTPVAGSGAWPDGATASLSAVPPTTGSPVKQIGTWLGPLDGYGMALVRLNVM